MSILEKVQCYLLDMDGTIYLGDRLLPGASELVQLLRAKDRPFIFLTNNSSRHSREYAAKLRGLQIDVDEKQIFTSGEAMAMYLADRMPGGRIFVVGTPAMEETLQNYGFRSVRTDPDCVVLGFDTTLTYDKLWRLCDLVREGVPYFATHPDINCPTESGFMPDIGATIAYVGASTGRQPDVVVGKPYQPMIEALTELSGCAPTEMCMVGDRLYTDIALGQWGLVTVLVLSGETRMEDLPGSPYRPDLVLAHVGELVEKLEG